MHSHFWDRNVASCYLFSNIFPFSLFRLSSHSLILVLSHLSFSDSPFNGSDWSWWLQVGLGPMVVGVGWNRGLSWLRPWAEDWGWGLRLMWGSGIGVEVRIGVAGVVGFHCSLCLGFLFFILVVGGWGCCCWWWLWLWLWPWLEVMSLKSSGHGGFESKYQREGEASSGWERWKDSGRERDRGRVRNNKKMNKK